MLKLAYALLLSSVVTGAARAHEVVPTIADLTVAEGVADISLRINLEAQLSGIDLDVVEDTNDAENAGDYDSLRASGAMVLRQQGVEEPYTGYLEGGTQSPEIELAGGGQETAWQAFLTYIPVGFDHILPKGLDHILFVLGLFFLSTHLKPLIWQVSAFTAAHTVTLALGALGLVTVPGSIVEPLIAASIVYVAVENIFSSGLSRWRPFVIFGFGLLHGLGFASVLGEFGLPDDQFIPALIGFNVGVEIGQLTVIAIMALCVWQALRVARGEGGQQAAKSLYVGLAVVALALCFVPMPSVATALEAPVPLFLVPLALVFTGCFLSVQFRQTAEPYRRFVAIPASVGIALVGAYWFIERVFL